MCIANAFDVQWDLEHILFGFHIFQCAQFDARCVYIFPGLNVFAFVGENLFVGNAWCGKQWMHCAVQWFRGGNVCLIATMEEQNTSAIVGCKTDVFHINRFFVDHPCDRLVLQIADKQLDQSICDEKNYTNKYSIAPDLYWPIVPGVI